MHPNSHQLNTSELGHNFINSLSSSDSLPFGGLSSIHNTTVVSDVESISNSIDKNVSGKLGIRQWYSLHLLNYCEGFYSPNALTPHSYNVTLCSNRTMMYHFDFTGIIGNELNRGKSGLTLKKIQWPSTIQDGLSVLNRTIDTTFILYMIGLFATGLALVTAPVTFFFDGGRFVPLGKAGLAFVRAPTILSRYSLLMGLAIVCLPRSRYCIQYCHNRHG